MGDDVATGPLLAEISRAVVQHAKATMGKGPERVRSYFLDDMLVIVSKGGFTTAEQTMVDVGQQDSVREFRRRLEHELAPQLQQLIAELTGREVLASESTVSFGPDRVIAIYVFDSTLAEHLAAGGHISG